jgi:hypothetical protein
MRTFVLLLNSTLVLFDHNYAVSILYLNDKVYTSLHSPSACGDLEAVVLRPIFESSTAASTG